MTIIAYLAAGFVLGLIGMGLLGWALVAGGERADEDRIADRGSEE